MAIISSGTIALTDLNDAIVSGTKPVDPSNGALWIDNSVKPSVLKVFENNIWKIQNLDIESLDPDMAEKITDIVESLGNISNDNLITVDERMVIKSDLMEIIGRIITDSETALPTITQLDQSMRGSFYSVRRQALNAEIESSHPAYIAVATNYQNLKTYLENLTPIKPWDVSSGNQDQNISVVKETFRDKWLQYYLATEALNIETIAYINGAQQELDEKINEVSLRDKTEILSGTEIFTDKADDNSVVHVEIDGKSYQNAGSGKNGFQKKGLRLGALGLGALVGAVLSENTGTNRLSTKLDSYSPVKPNTKYTVSWKIGNIEVGQTDSSNVITNVSSGWKTSSPFTFTTGESTTRVHFNISKKDNSSILLEDVTDWDIQLEEGSVATPYEPPAPTPDYPSEINSLNNVDVVSSVGKENLVKKTNVSWSRATSVSNEVLYYQLINGHNPYIVWDSRPLLKSGVTYSFSMKWKRPKQSTYGGAIRLISDNTTITYLANTTSAIPTGEWEELVYVYTPTSDTLFGVQLYMNLGTSLTEAWVKDLKIEKGEKSLYSPAPEDTQPDTPNPRIYKTNISLSEPLRSVGNVKDRLFRDSDGLWKVERNVGEYTFTDHAWAQGASSGGWNVSGDTLPFYSPIPINQMINPARSVNALTTHFNTNFSSTSTIVYSDNEGFSMGYTTWGLIFRIKKSRLSTLDGTGFRQWMKENTVTALYEMTTPTIETLPDDLQQKLNNVQSYKGSNYVYTVLPDKSDILTPNLRATFKSNMWYRLNVLNENIDFGNRNWARNGNFAYKPEDSAWKDYYKGTTRAIADISSEAPPFKNALQIQQTTSGISGIVDAVIWEGASAKELVGKKVSMATWLKYQNIANSELVMQLQVTGKKADGTFVYDYPKVFAHTGTDLSWKRQAGTVQINIPAGAVEVTRIVFRLGLSKAGTGTFWATGIQIQTGSVIGEWNLNPQDVELEFEKTEARFILTEKEIGLSVKKGELINGLFVNGDGTKITGEHFQVDSKTTFKDDLTMNAGRIKSKDGGISIDLNEGTMNLSRPLTINAVPVLTETDLNELELKDGKSAYEIAVGNGFIGSESQWLSSLKGLKGDTGISVKSVTEYYLASSSSTGVITSTAGWTTTIQTMTIDKKYLWNYEKVTFSDNTSQNTVPVVIGVYGETGATGATGRSITGVSEYYLATNSASGVNRSTAGWTLTMQTTSPTKKYLWNYETITWSSAPTITYVEPIIIGIHGDQGIQGERGISISNVDVEYAQSTSATVTPTTGWSTTAPVWKDGQYIWSRTKTAYSTGSPTYSTPVCITGQKGTTGTTGSAGRGITSINEQYYLSNSKTVQSGGEWVESPPTWISGRYMWTRSKITYNNPYNIEYTTAVVDSAWEALEGVTLKDKDYQIGTEVFTDKADDAVAHVEVDGKSYQHININLLQGVDIIEDTYINSSTSHEGGESAGKYFITGLIDVTNIKSITATATVASDNESLRVMFLNSSLGKIVTHLETSLSITWSVPSNAQYAVLCSHRSNGNIANFTGNIPTPDYPVPINSLNNVDVVSSVGGENLVEREGELEGYLSGQTNLVASANSRTMLEKIPVTPNEKLTFSKTTSGIDPYWRWDMYNSSENYIDRAVNSTDNFEWIVPNGVHQIRVSYPNIEKVRLQRGGYSPAPEDIQPDTPDPTIYKTNISLPEPLRSVGDIKDRVFRDSQDSLWKVERKIGEKIFDGTEAFGASSTYGAYYATTNSLEDATIIGVSSNYLKSATGTEVNNGLKNAIGLAPNTKAIRMSVLLNGVQLTHITIKSWLTEKYNEGNPLIIQYALATPSVETLPDDMQQKLNNIQSYGISNHVYTMSDLKPTLSTTFKSKGWYDKYLTETELKLVNDKTDSKADQEQVDKVAEDLSNFETIVATKEELGEIITSLNDYKDMIESNEASLTQASQEIVDLLGRVPILENNLGEFTESWKFLDTYMRAGEEGFIIGSETGNTAIRISDQRIDFLDGSDTPVAFITNQVMQINRGIFVQSATIGEHKIETIAGGHTIWTWIPTV